jgi:branched-chain amino acid transport system ATP-binding protein
MLITQNLCKYFGGLKAVDGIDLEIKEGAIHGIIGPNGAGKTTLFNLISGYYRPTQGGIWFNGEKIDGLEAHEIVRKGIARTFQIVRPFTELSVLENVLVAYGYRYYRGALSLFGSYRGSQKACFKILDFVGLAEKSDLPAGALPIGMLRQLEIARAIALNPSLLLLDEPVSGLTEEEKGVLKNLIRKVVEEKVTVILVEHTMSFVMDVCERITVLDHGRVIAEGTPSEVANDERVIEAYLGMKSTTMGRSSAAS